MRRRIAVDWDSRNALRNAYFLFRILRDGFEELIIKRSFRKGFHVFIWTRAQGNKFALRKRYGDDTKHLNMDKYHRNARQTMFETKRKVKIVKDKKGVLRIR